MINNSNHNSGIIFDIQKFSVHDGPGIRTTVFFKGCMMRCPWCHNPESFRSHIEIGFTHEKCISCGACIEACKEMVHTLSETGVHQMDFSKCTACGECISVCPQRCLQLFGREITVDEILTEVMKDKKYYDSSGGGITISGGEPTFQMPFLLNLLAGAKQCGLHVCLETNGAVSEQNLSKIIPFVDLFLFDYKATGEAHERLTLVSEQKVLEALAYIDKENKPVILRCPIIQGINDTAEHFEAIRKLKETYSCIKETEVMAYHASGTHKWEALGLPYSLAGLPSATPDMQKIWSAQCGG